ncbi:phage tail fiber protein [Serratia fonticola]
MAIISDVLRGPYGDIQPDVVITMRAKGTSAKVLAANSSSVVTDAAGKYSMTVFPGEYTVNVSTLGDVGDIKVFTDSVDGTLNDFLNAPSKPEDLTPEVVKTVDTMRAAAANSATAAKASENNAAAAMTNAVSKVSTADQSVASKVLFNRPLRLSSGTDGSNFLPPNQGSWITWNRIPGTGTSDFVNHKGTAGGGFRFWNTDGTTAGALAAFNGGDASFVQYAPVGATALTHRFLDNASVEKGAIISNPTDGSMRIRWNGTSYSMDCRTDGFVAHQRGATMIASLSTPEDVATISSSVGNMPISFRGADVASFNAPNNYSIGTWYGFSVVPTIGTGLAAGVEQGKPVFFVNARTGTAHALKNIYVGTTAVVKSGDYGLGGTTPVTYSDMTNTGQNMFYNTPANTAGAASNVASAGIIGGYDGGSRWQLGWEQGALKVALATRVRVSAGTWSPWYAMWHAGNTTVDANGFLKKASPIVKLFGDGSCELNAESQGVTIERLSEGVYRVSGVLGFNADGAWGGAGNGIEIPVDDNKRPLIWVESKVLPDGDIEIRTYHRTYDTGPYSARNIEAMDSGEVDKKKRPIFVEMPDGTPIDIPEGRFIDLRVEMPASDEPEPEFEPEPESQVEQEVEPENGEALAPGAGEGNQGPSQEAKE